MRRRDFMHAGLAGALALLNARLWAAGPGDAKLLVVMLRGAYDGASLLVPWASDFYYRSRPTIAVPRPGSGDANAAVALDRDWALNAAVRDSLHASYTSRQAAFVPFSGSDDLSRSHFQAQDLMELGQGGGGALDYSSGYLNRLVEALSGRNAGGVSFTNNLTPVFKGAVPVPNISFKGNPKSRLPPRSADLIASLYEGTRLSGLATSGMETKKRISEELMTEMAESSRGAGAARAFESQARAIGKLMRDQPAYSIGFVDVGGWDTHVNQGSAEGALANNLAGLANGLAAFANEMGARWKSTVVVVMSEFGRTFRENGNRGSDHGHGNTLWVLGGGIAGGRIAGRQVALAEANLFQNRDLPVLNDYRSVLAHLFSRMYGLGDAALGRVLPGAKAEDYGIV
jgi:uncharacterized protein (DUF1501 family)